MSYSSPVDKVTVDSEWIRRFKKALNNSKDAAKNVIYSERRGVDNVIDELVAEAVSGENFNLDSFLAEEASNLHEDLSVDFNRKEAALLVYRRASERMGASWKNFNDLKVSNSSNPEEDFREAQGELNNVKNYSKLLELVWSRYDLYSFKGYDLAHLALIFEELDDLDFINEGRPKRAARRIVEKDKNRIKQLREDNEKIREDIPREQDNLGRVY